MKLINWLHHFEERLIGTLLIAMTLLVFVEVILRFGFNTGIEWAQEVTLYLSAWMVLLGASWGIREGAHIGVDAFVKLLPSRQRRIITLIAIVLCLIYCALFIQGSWVYLSKMAKIGIEMDDVPLTKWKAMSVLMIGFVLLAIRFAQLGWAVITGKQDGFVLADEGRDSMHLVDDESPGEK
ncbi:TRAP transporter small permease [Celerinatantimonas diazotrophica]|uniref:TRAP transporter small permease protein n=1 Tax=Celerinatantimonas diazotrophica TaxID=412034 RepID=A0A4R1J9U3_9GAMM|nr:TRAP transporter small permease [Celerinatantimonas diazotrophica]TCK46879.1 C4-dicarboxylate transporter DctQ subunit [Celerinatantimonas diazotrophica]CAG9295646.1 C4-dicarboxylate TRAP transporter small permease protein DctQ [Celerinatantimonas diazotrophica]